MDSTRIAKALPAWTKGPGLVAEQGVGISVPSANRGSTGAGPKGDSVPLPPSGDRPHPYAAVTAST